MTDPPNPKARILIQETPENDDRLYQFIIIRAMFHRVHNNFTHLSLLYNAYSRASRSGITN